MVNLDPIRIFEYVEATGHAYNLSMLADVAVDSQRREQSSQKAMKARRQHQIIAKRNNRQGRPYIRAKRALRAAEQEEQDAHNQTISPFWRHMEYVRSL